MSGVATPPVIVEPFAKNAAGANITNPIPVASQTGITPGRASYDDGFVPLNMTPKTSGGIPPFGSDMNGILFALSAWCAMLQAGQGAAWDTDAATAFAGYKVGAVLRGVTNPLQLWTNLLDGNTDDPDSDPTNWVSSIPLWVSTAPTAGAHNNFVLPTASDLALDIDTTAGAMDFSGFVAQRDGQRVTISNTGANLLTIDALSGSSSAANQVRAPADLGIVQNQSLTIQYSTGAGKWLVA